MIAEQFQGKPSYSNEIILINVDHCQVAHTTWLPVAIVPIAEVKVERNAVKDVSHLSSPSPILLLLCAIVSFQTYVDSTN